MNSEQLIHVLIAIGTALLSACVVIAGWIIAHRQEMERDKKAKQRDLRVDFLINAYRTLEFASNRDPSDSDEYMHSLSRAIADIQLFGTSEQINLAQQLAREMSATRSANSGPLLENLW